MIIQIVGYKNSGKTTLMTHAVSFLKEKGFTVATIKHHGHLGNDITLQNDDVDHMKHFNSGADQSIVQGETFQQTVTRISKQNLTDIIKESVEINNFVPEYLDFDADNLKGTFVRFPERSELPAEINEQLIVEYYSR